jgi:triacylglycerol esterase/lipase EstA (alpha/beta hydrolase family)
MTSTKRPIILAQGIARFDFLLNHVVTRLSMFGFNLDPAADGLHYFKGIARHLRKNGFEVFHTSVAFAAGVERRAQELRDQINAILLSTGKDKAHIIAHSMGGLDARYMIVNFGMADKVASLTTIGTPHLGTSFADWGIEHGGHPTINLLSRVIDLGGFADLSTIACKTFNEGARNAEASNDVVYQVYSGAERKSLVFAPLQLSWSIINEREGDNDGLVPVTSQMWQSELIADNGTSKSIKQNIFPIPVDHLNEIGWWDLAELQDSDLFHTDIVQAANEYEANIRDVYLNIANALFL